MTINIDNYVDRWMNDYIVYHPKNFISRGDTSRASIYLNQKYMDARGKMREDAQLSLMRAMLNAMKAKSSKAAAGLNFLNDLQNGQLIEDTLEWIELGLNEIIEQLVLNFDFEDIIKGAKKFNNSLSNGAMSKAQMDEFFDLLMQGVSYAIKFDKNLLDLLSDIGKSLSGNKDFKIDSKWNKKAIKNVTKLDIELANKIIDLLARAVDRFENTTAINSKGKTVSTGPAGTLSRDSFSSTINNIFSTVIGEEISRRMIINAFKEVDRLVEEGIDGIFSLLLKEGIKVNKAGANSFTRGGSRKSIDNRVSKVDIFNLDAFKLTVTLPDNSTYEIEIGTNTSVKWYSSFNERSSIHVVSGTPFGSYFEPGTEEHYFAYNIMTHRFDPKLKDNLSKHFHTLYRLLRAATAATFFNEWISGDAARIKNSVSYVNKVLFLMINGKIYSVTHIIKNICDDLAKREGWSESKDMPFNMSVSGGVISNKWRDKEEDSPNTNLAIKRAKAVTEVINKLVITASLNANVLLQYAY